ncbi:unnamed protein product [Tilletia controversa]|nr:hypothetical protein A4X03_0g7895 [Tilletia caries]CAD6960287.1 unnamed protein product [Tilletia controversa]CAD6983501.1 unnamed protein product [Tilletia controversa]
MNATRPARIFAAPAVNAASAGTGAGVGRAAALARRRFGSSLSVGRSQGEDGDEHEARMTRRRTSSPSSYLFPTPSALSTFGADPDLLQQFLRRRPTSIAIRQLLALSPPPSQESSPTLEQLLHSARFTSTELPIRLSHRVADFRALPFIVASNPYISRIAQLYAQGFAALAAFSDPVTGRSRITTFEENKRFAIVLEKLIDDAAQNVPTLARGFLECERHMSKTDIAAFLDAAIHSRIAIRLIGEQHLALTAAAEDAAATGTAAFSPRASSSSVGVIDTQLNPARIVRMCASYVHDLCEGTLGAAPDLIIEGDESSTYAGCGQHLEYIVTELLKNSYRATTERWLALQAQSHRRNQNRERSSKGAYGRIANVLEREGPIEDVVAQAQRQPENSTDENEAPPPVKVTIAKSPHHLSLRIRDRGGGISPRNLPHVFSYAFSTSGKGDEEEEATDAGDSGPYGMQSMGGMGNDDLGMLNGGGSSGLGQGALTSNLGTLSGLGYGLAMARIYSTWAPGGGLDLVSLYGHGCDAYVKLPANLVEVT